MATCFVAARTNNNVMLYCVDFFVHVVVIISTLFIFCELERPRGPLTSPFYHITDQCNGINKRQNHTTMQTLCIFYFLSSQAITPLLTIFHQLSCTHVTLPIKSMPCIF
jgi:hypothetical protein